MAFRDLLSYDYMCILQPENKCFFLGAQVGDFYQACGSLIAGLLALYAGKLAYDAATAETKRQLQQKQSLTRAYFYHVAEQLLDIKTAIDWNRTVYEIGLPIGDLKKISWPKSLSSDQWQELGNLTDAAQDQIFRIKQTVKSYNADISRIRQFQSKTDTNGFTSDNLIEEFEKQLNKASRNLVFAIDDILSCLTLLPSDIVSKDEWIE